MESSFLYFLIHLALVYLTCFAYLKNSCKAHVPLLRVTVLLIPVFCDSLIRFSYSVRTLSQFFILMGYPYFLGKKAKIVRRERCEQESTTLFHSSPLYLWNDAFILLTIKYRHMQYVVLLALTRG
jgi:hypothetical protein